MKFRTDRLCTFTLISLLSLFGFAAYAGAQNTHNRQSPSLQSRSKAARSHHTARPETASLTTLYSFCSQTNCTDGANSAAGLIRDSSGNLYGTTANGGANTAINGGSGGGTVFKVSGSTETVLYSFGGSENDGFDPVAGLIADSSGNLYGTTFSGGTTGDGTVFKLEPPAEQGGAWTEVILYNFCSKKNCVDGANPASALIQDSSGDFYGTTTAGGSRNDGVIFELTPAGKETVLYSFKGAGDGISPEAGVIRDASGNLYGTTVAGGASSGGTIFKLAPPVAKGKPWTETILYSFCADGGGSCTDGGYPGAGLIEDSGGNFYGTASLGGTYTYGAVFELNASGTESVLYSFCSAQNADCTDGAYPAAALIEDSGGNLYGTTTGGGGGNPECNVSGLLSCGTAFELSPPAQQGGAWTETVIYSFCSANTNCTDGESPAGDLILDTTGNLYGTTSLGGANGVNSGGTVFRISSSTLPSSVTLTSSPNPSNINQSVTLTAVVSGSGPTPTGTVTFEEGSTQLGTATLSSGTATLTTKFATGGSYSIVASYSGDQNYSPSTSSPITQVVLFATTTAVTSNLNPSIYGQAVTFSATVSSSGPTPTGTVTFKSGSATLGTGTLSGGKAQFTTSTLGVGTLKITAVYGGDAANAGSTSPTLKQVVDQATSTTTVVSSVNPSQSGQKVTFTATVTSPTTTPTGKVTFMDGSTALKTVSLTNGTASYSTTTLAVGSHNITAVYAGNTDVAGSTSPVLVQTVN